jgi:hypothetical protein
MATQSFFVVNSKDLSFQVNSDAVIEGKDKKFLGEAYKKKAPSDRTFLVCKLQDHWIITNEEYKKLKQYDKNIRNL